MHCVRFMQCRPQRFIETLNPEEITTITTKQKQKHFLYYLIIINMKETRIFCYEHQAGQMSLYDDENHTEKPLESQRINVHPRLGLKISNILQSFWLNYHRNTIDSCVKFFSNLYAVQSAAFILSNREFPLYCTRLYAPHACLNMFTHRVRACLSKNVKYAFGIYAYYPIHSIHPLT